MSVNSPGRFKLDKEVIDTVVTKGSHHNHHILDHLQLQVQQHHHGAVHLDSLPIDAVKPKIPHFNNKYLEQNLVMSRYKGVASLILFHQKPLEVMGDKLTGVKHNSALDVSVLFLVDVLNWAHDVFLPEGAQLLVRL